LAGSLLVGAKIVDAFIRWFDHVQAESSQEVRFVILAQLAAVCPSEEEATPWALQKVLQSLGQFANGLLY